MLTDINGKNHLLDGRNDILTKEKENLHGKQK
jgi:hypothetical protein